MSNVAMYRENTLSAQDVIDFGADSRRARDGLLLAPRWLWTQQWRADQGLDTEGVFTPDDILTGSLPRGRVLLFDDDSFYIGSVLAEVLRAAGNEVIYVTPDDAVALWTTNTQEFRHIQRRLRSHRRADRDRPHAARLARAARTARLRLQRCRTNDRVRRDPYDHGALAERSIAASAASARAEWRDAGIESVTAIGDCLAPGLIAHAVYAGHRFAQELDTPRDGEVAFRRHFPAPR